MFKEESNEWYAFYTQPRAEKKVAEKLEQKSFEHYLPLIKTLKQWSDRRKMVIEPVFKSYIFVNLVENDIKKILNIDGVMRVISFGSVPQKIPENQIHYLKMLLESPEEISVESELKQGEKVRVIQGPFIGIEGIITGDSPKNFSVNIDIVGHSINVKISPAYLERI